MRPEILTRAPLSHQQEGLWLANELAPDGASYNNVLGLRLRGPLDVGALERSIGEIVRRHQALRTTFDEAGGQPAQVVHDQVEVPLEVVDLGPACGEAELRERAAAEAGSPLDLRLGPLIRPVLLRAATDDHLLVVTLHHIVADGWSVGILVRELLALYEAFAAGRPSPLAEPALQYADYAIRQRERLRGERLEREVAHWRRELDGAPQFLVLPTDRPRPAVQTSTGATHRFRWPAGLAARLKTACRAEGVTLFMALLAAYQAVLHRYSGQDDILVGTPITNRFQSELEDVFGYFLNMLVIRTDFSGDPSFRDLLARVKAASVRAFSHAELPFDRLLASLRPVRDPSRSPVFQVAFALQGGPGEDVRGPGLSLPDLDVTPTEIAPGAAKYDLTLCVIDAADGLTGHVEYNADLFDAGTIERMTGHLEVLLDAALRDPGQPVARLPLLRPRERARLLYEWNDDGPSVPALDGCIHELFEAQVDRTPGAVAIVVGSERWTYAELDRRANRLAHRLRALGVGPEQTVGLLLERSAQLAVALLGVLKSGGAYVALDAGHPPERLAYLLRDARAMLLLTEESLAAHRPAGGPPCLRLDADWPSIAAEPAERPLNLATPANLAYAIYTSGSTGRPKAVATEHRNAVSLIRWTLQAYGREAMTGMLAASSACFDCTPFELFAPLACGGKAVVAPSTLDLPGLPAADEVRLVSTVPSVVVELLKEGGIPDSVRILNIGGEALPPSLVRRVYESTGVERLYNLYGPSEATTYATRTLVPAGSERVTIGRPISGTRAYILDDGLELTPIGVPGQLCLSGGGLARGYLQRPDMTAAKFVPHPFSEEHGARLYLTGDVARYLPNGDIEFIGRADDQVKIRGIRVEPGEVQAALSAHPDVREALVLPEAGPNGVRLVAYVLPAAGSRLPAAALRDHLRERVPAYMIPAAFVTVESFQLAKNGKIDRQALPREEGDGHRPYVAPRTPEEEILAGIWEDVLEVGRVGLHDNFFELGGHSLLAVQVLSRMRHELGADVPLSVLFETGSLGELAERLRRTGRAAESPIEPEAGGGPRPLSFAQQRLWFLEQFAPGGVAYNVPLAVRLRGPLDVPALEAALNEVVRRHASLRTRFLPGPGAPVQEVRPGLRLELAVTDVGAAPDPMAAARELARGDVATAFDLAEDPLIRGRLVRLGGEDHVLVLVLHHIVTDGWSMGVIREELAVLYRAFRAGLPSPLDEPRLQYADFAAWQRRWLDGPGMRGQMGYWKERLARLPAALDVPTDHPRPAVRGAAGSTALFKVPPHVTAGLRRLARDEGATLFMTLLAAFQVLLHRYSGQTDLAVGTPVAGRGRVELEKLVGFFLNTLVIRSDLGGRPAFREVVRRVRRDTLEAFANQDVPFERLVEELGVRRDLSRPPLFQAMFTLQNARPGQLQLEDVRAEPVALENPAAKFDLDLTMLEGDGFLYGGLRYSAELFEPATARRMLGHFRRLLAAVAADPDRAIDELSLAGDAERRRLLTRWSPGPEAAVPPAGVHELVAAQARRTPDAVAVAAPGAELTYAELDRRAERLARRLRELGVRPEDRVALHVGRSPAMAVALLGVLKAGGAYVPLDPAYPAERLAGMLADSGAHVVVADGAPAPPAGESAVLTLDVDGPAPAAGEEAWPLPIASPDQLAYVAYTSGSTGRPKGVAVTHRALGNVLAAFGRDPGLGAEDVLLAVTSLGFDIAGLELLMPLTVGARVVVADAAAVADGARLAELVERFGVTALQATPVTWRLLLDAGWRERAGMLAFCGGESLPADVARRLLDLGVRLHNVYGPTETTVWSTMTPIAPGGPITIGRPVANTDVHVLDDRLEPAPAGVPGELCIGGAGLARGYLGLGGATAERFVPHPLRGGGERLYRTGDLARFRADGTLEYLGRRDRQVKLHGVRIEPGEVEAALADHPGVAAAVVTPGRDALVAHVVPAPGGRMPEGTELRAHLRRTLPDAMVPSAFVELAELPRTPGGKVDRSALPPPADGDVGRRPYVAPRSADERALAAIWCDVLGVEQVGVHDDFFELGGQSLLATQVAAGIREELDVDLPLNLLFRAPTLAELAPLVAVARANGGEWPVDMDPEACAADAAAGAEAR